MNSINKLKLLVKDNHQRQIVRYFVMASVLVVFELFTFWVFNSLMGLSYLIATPLSMGISFFLNWYLGRRFIFTDGERRAHIEFTLVFLASLIGVGIQLAVVTFTIEVLSLVPLLGKLIAICITFFWNYLIRKYYIFK